MTCLHYFSTNGIQRKKMQLRHVGVTERLLFENCFILCAFLASHLSHGLNQDKIFAPSSHYDCLTIQMHIAIFFKAVEYFEFRVFAIQASQINSAAIICSQTSVFEHNPFQKVVRKVICSKSETIFPIKINANNFNPFQL